MNKHFDDARYYTMRAFRNVKHGVKTELEPMEAWVRAKTGREKAPEPGRVDMIRSELRGHKETIETEVRQAFDEGRGRLHAFRGKGN